jgi:hypothetical protein
LKDQELRSAKHPQLNDIASLYKHMVHYIYLIAVVLWG